MLQDSLEGLHSLALPVHTPLSIHGGANVAAQLRHLLHCAVGSALASEAVSPRVHEAMVVPEEHACVQKLFCIATCTFIYHVKR